MSAYVLPATHVHLDPTLANKLRHDFKILEEGAGFYFLAFGASALLVGFPLIFVKENLDKRPFILIGTFVAGIAQFLIGPSHILHLPNNKEMVLAGVIINGVGYSLGYNFLYAEAW